MLKRIQHKRFSKTMSGMLLSLRCYRYAQSAGSIVPVGNEKDSKNMWPDYIRT